MSNDALNKASRWVARRLPENQTIWFKRLRCEEHPWQAKQQRLRELSQANESAGSGHRAGSDVDARRLDLRGTPFTVVTRGYDAQAAVNYNVLRVRAAFREAGVEHVQLPLGTPFKPVVVVAQPDTSAVLRELEQKAGDEGWSLKVELATKRKVSISAAKQRPEAVARIVVERKILGPSGYLMSTPLERVVIEPWLPVLTDDMERADGSTHLRGTLVRQTGRRGTLVEYLTPEAWAAMVRGEDRVLGGMPHLYEVTEPIDLVYTWVDGDDPKWQERKRAAQGLIDEDAVNETALSRSRFENRDELKYSLRSVEAYANWVNHIYIVTDGQVPSWLDVTHPKITVVDHRDIFTDQDVLPVFNSHAIESQLHHIEGLSERYLYMNDDLFFMRPVRPDRFFTSNGLSKFFPSRAPLDIDEPSARDLPVLSAAKNGRSFMRAAHGRTVTNKFKHTPHAMQRSVMQQMEAEHADLFAKVAASMFRDPADYSLASSLAHFHAYAIGKAVPGNIAYDYLDISSDRARLRLEWFLFQRKLEVICLNDTDLKGADAGQISQLLHEFLERRFSIVSSFEK